MDISSDCDPCAKRSHSKAKSKHNMREGTKAFGIGIEQEYEQHRKGEPETQSVELQRDQNEDKARYHREENREISAQQPSGKSAHSSAGIHGIDFPIHDAIKGHRGTARPDHGEDNPKQLGFFRPAVRCKHSAQQRKRQRKKCVLKLDHLQGDLEVLYEGHKQV